MAQDSRFSRINAALLFFLSIIVAGTVLKAMASVVLPLVFAILLSFALAPVIQFLHRRFKLPWILGIAIVITICLLVITVLVSLLASSLRTIFAIYPRYETRFTIIYSTIADIFKLPFDAKVSLLGNLWNQLGIRNFMQHAAISLSNWLVDFSRNMILVMLFIIFFLMEFRSFRKKIIYAVGRTKRKQAMSIINDIIRQITNYISIKFFISLATGLLVFVGTLAIGLDFAILWGFIAFVTNFIPNFGSIFSGLLTTLFALLQFWPKPGPVIVIGCIMLGVNMVLGNFIEPRMQGQNLGLSPFLILVSLSVWGWIWGFSGLILAVPMMVILQIVCKNVSYLHPLSIMMGSASAVKKRESRKKDKNPGA